MAAKKDSANLTHSQIHGGDFVFDFCCTPCDKKKYNREATKYCVNCSEYFWAQCVKNHKDFKVLSDHVLIDPKTTTPALSQSGTRHIAAPTELCKKHRLKLVEMYSAEEDIVGCSACFLLDHKSCSDIHYIPEYIQSSVQIVQVDQINNTLTKAIKHMGKLKTEHDNLNENLDKSKAICKQEIQNYRKDINQITDKIEETTLADLDARHSYTRKKTNVANQSIQDLHNKMVRLKSEIESDQSNDCQKFVSAKLSQIVITQGEELHAELSHDQATKLKFTRNTDIMTFLLSIETLGMLSPPVKHDNALSTDATSGKQPQQKNSTTKFATSPSASGDNRENKSVSTRQETAVVITTRKEGLYKLVDKSEYNLQQPDDKNTYILDITVSDDEQMIHVADWNNGVITLNTDGHVVWRYSGIELRAAQGLCTDGNGHVIVCGGVSNNVIQLSPDGHYMGEIVTCSDEVNNPCSVSYDRNKHTLIIGKMLSNTIIVYTVQ